MAETDKEYAYSTNGEDYIGSFDTREAAAEEGNDAAQASSRGEFWTGRCIPYSADSFRVDVDRVLDDLTCQANDIVGDHADDWLSHVTKEDEKALEDALTAAFVSWANGRGYQPTFYGIDDVQRHKAEAANVA